MLHQKGVCVELLYEEEEEATTTKVAKIFLKFQT